MDFHISILMLTFFTSIFHAAFWVPSKLEIQRFQREPEEAAGSVRVNMQPGSPLQSLVFIPTENDNITLFRHLLAMRTELFKKATKQY